MNAATTTRSWLQRILCTLAICTLAITAPHQAGAEQAPVDARSRQVFGAVGCGDANGDGVISSSDSLATLMTAVGLDDCTGCRCDVNASGKVTATDSILGLQLAIGLPVTIVCNRCDAGTCGNGIVDGADECDGADDAVCPGLCRTNCTCGEFADDFDRPDADDLGEGWVSSPGNPVDHWTLEDGRAVMRFDSVGWSMFRGRLRPVEEAVENVEASVEFVTSDPGNYPQIWLRFRSITTNDLEGYAFYVSDDSDDEGIGVVRWGGPLWAWHAEDHSWQPEAGTHYRMIARAENGDGDAVVLTMRVLDLDAGGQEVYSNLWIDDGMTCSKTYKRPCSIQAPGRSGLSGYGGCIGCTIAYDNFHVVDLDVAP